MSIKPGNSNTQPPLPDLVGRNLGPVILLEKIGQGSMGVVYRGFQQSLSRPVAVKIVFRRRLDGLFTPERFRQEAEVVANLEHPNIVSIFELGEHPDLLYFVMQLVDGISLSQWLKLRKKHPLPRKRRPALDDILCIAQQGLEVLDHASGQGIVHRDIKPENIMWNDKSRRAMVTDFGLASIHHSPNQEERAFVLGSPLYVSPEQARSEDVDGRADIFSFGCVLLEMTLGFLPVKVERPEKIFLTRARESPDMFTGMALDHMPSVPVEWSDFIAHALVPNRSDRYANAAAMLADLKSLEAKFRGYEL